MLKLIAIIFILTLSQHALGSANECLFLFESEHNDGFQIRKPTREQRAWVPVKEILTNHSRYKTITDAYTITIEEPSPVQKANGAGWIVRKKPDMSWESFHGPFKGAAQGDPRYPMAILGLEVSAVLGFEMLDSNTIIIPSVKRLNWGIEKLNSWLVRDGKKTILYRFYEQRDDTESNYSYEASRGGIPVSVSNVYLTIHDIAFHVAMIGEPTDITMRRIKKIEILDFLGNKSIFAESETNPRIDVSLSTNYLVANALAERARHNSLGSHERYFNELYYDSEMAQALINSAKPEDKDWLRMQFNTLDNLPKVSLNFQDIMMLTLQRKRELRQVVRKNMPN